MLNFDLLKNKTRVVVAMSGGVDSSTVAAILHDKGCQVIGITLQLYDHGMAVNKQNACCAGQDIYDAKNVANKLGIPHYVIDYETKFKQYVIDDFIDSYARGETPSPCIKCNQSVKFDDLLKMSQDLNAEALVTGHYARRIDGDNGPELHTGIDLKKDQSYFLFAITKKQLEYVHFPLGDYTKGQTRKIASAFGLSISDKPDSQDICFVPNGDYREVINKLRPNLNKPGEILHVDGFKVGTHNGIINYTIGQRRKVGVSFNEPLYVTKIDPVNNIIYVGPSSTLDSTSFIIKDVNWLAGDIENGTTLEVAVKIRSTRPGTLAKISKISNDKILVHLTSPEKAVTPGQACVIYNNNRVLGGGWIT